MNKELLNREQIDNIFNYIQISLKVNLFTIIYDLDLNTSVFDSFLHSKEYGDQIQLLFTEIKTRLSLMDVDKLNKILDTLNKETEYESKMTAWLIDYISIDKTKDLKKERLDEENGDKVNENYEELEEYAQEAK